MELIVKSLLSESSFQFFENFTLACLPSVNVSSLKDVISNLGLSAPIVTFQGAHIADSFTGNVFWKKIIDDFLLDELIEIFQNIDNEILFYTETEIFTNKISDWNNNYSRRNNSNLILLNNICELYEKEIIRKVAELKEERRRVFEALQSLPIRVWPSEANFLLFKPETIDAYKLWEGLLEEGILVRDCSSWEGLEGCLRVTIGNESENNSFLTAVRKIVK